MLAGDEEERREGAWDEELVSSIAQRLTEAEMATAHLLPVQGCTAAHKGFDAHGHLRVAIMAGCSVAQFELMQGPPGAP
jgi:hypothetical protein